MIISGPVALLLTVVAGVLHRQRVIGTDCALACTTFEFCLASTGVALAVTEFLTAVAGLVSRS